MWWERLRPLNHHHLLPPWMFMSKQVELEAELELKPIKVGLFTSVSDMPLARPSVQEIQSS